MKTLALDPANTTGFAWTDGTSRKSGVWNLVGDKDTHLGDRVHRFHQLILRAHREWGFELIAIEDAGFGSIHAHVQALHNELRGIVKLAAKETGSSLLMLKPKSIKKFATGNGNAPKDQMILAAKRLLGYSGDDDNEADALFILEFAKNPGLMIDLMGAIRPKKRKISMRRTGKVKQQLIPGLLGRGSRGKK